MLPSRTSSRSGVIVGPCRCGARATRRWWPPDCRTTVTATTDRDPWTSVTTSMPFVIGLVAGVDDLVQQPR